MRTALLSVYDKTGIAEFAEGLAGRGWALLSSGGTARAIAAAGLEVTDIGDIVGEPILGHRVVTLSRQIHAGLLARDIPEDRAELARIGVPWIDLVCVDFYPMKSIIGPDANLTDVIEMTDIGGPTMVRSAAKGNRIVICDPADRQAVLAWLAAGEPEREEFVNDMAAKAEYLVARYCLESARFRSNGRYDGMLGQQVAVCAYGENPFMTPAGLFSAGSGDPFALDTFEQVEGSSPSYINWTYLDRMLTTMTHLVAAWRLNFDCIPYIALAVKHGNCCGAAISSASPVEAVQKMVKGDPLAIFGGGVMTNFPIDRELALSLLNHGREQEQGPQRYDMVVAPGFSNEAIDMLGRKHGKCRMLKHPWLADPPMDTASLLRPLRGTFLRQPNFGYIPNFSNGSLTLHGEMNEVHRENLTLAWGIGAFSDSNTITVTQGNRLIGNGVGQQARVHAAKLAVERARTAGHGDSLNGAAAYSDSFFPHEDGMEALAEAGVRCIMTSSGSIADKAVIARAHELRVTLVMVPDKVGRGFFGH